MPTVNLPIPPIPNGVHFMARRAPAAFCAQVVTEVFGSTVRTAKNAKVTKQNVGLDAALVDPWLDVTGITHRRAIHALLAVS